MRTKTIPEAAKLLEVSERSVFRYMNRYEIDYKEIKRARKLRNTKEKMKEFESNLWKQYKEDCIVGDHAYSMSFEEWYTETFNTKEI